MRRNKENKFQPPRIPEFALYRKYIDFIKEGAKPIEGRINSGRFKRLLPNNVVKFFDKQDPGYNTFCQITGISRYRSFREMLEQEGYQSMIPDAHDLEEAIRVYNSIPGYPERARRYGVLALRLKVIHEPNCD